MPRLFVAAWPDAAVRADLHRLPTPSEPGVRLVPPDNWHVTLRFVGDADADDLVALLSEADLPRTAARLGPAIERLDARQIVAPVAGVDELAAAVRAASESVGEIDGRPFRGHLTVARTKPGAPSTLIGAKVDAAFDVHEVAVVASELLPSGVVYTTLVTLPTG